MQVIAFIVHVAGGVAGKILYTDFLYVLLRNAHYDKCSLPLGIEAVLILSGDSIFIHVIIRSAH